MTSDRDSDQTVPAPTLEEAVREVKDALDAVNAAVVRATEAWATLEAVKATEKAREQ